MFSGSLHTCPVKAEKRRLRTHAYRDKHTQTDKHRHVHTPYGKNNCKCKCVWFRFLLVSA